MEPEPAQPTPPRPGSSAAIWWAGAMLLLAAGMFAVAFPLIAHSDRLTDIGKLSQYRTSAFIAFTGGIVLLFVAYGLGWRSAWRTPADASRPVWLVGIAGLTIMATMYPVNAIDLFIYVVRSRVFTTHGFNPQVVPPADLAADPMMRFASAEWSVTVSPYGPLWHLIAAPVTAIAGDNLIVALLGFKLLAVLAILAGAAIIATWCRGAGLPVAAAALVYLWNPLLLWEGAGNGHNDPVMMVPVLAALLAWQRKRDWLVVPLLVMAVCLKYVAIAGLPIVIVALWRRQPDSRQRVRLMCISAVVSSVVVGVALAPWFDLGAVWSSLREQGGLFLTSPAAVALTFLRDTLGDATRTVLMLTGGGIVALVAVMQMVRTWRDPDHLTRGLFETMFTLLLVGTWNFRPWYLIWLVALVALLPAGWPLLRTSVWTAGALLSYAVFIWVWHWWPVPFQPIQLIGVLVMTGPALLLTLAALIWGWRQWPVPPAPEPPPLPPRR